MLTPEERLGRVATPRTWRQSHILQLLTLLSDIIMKTHQTEPEIVMRDSVPLTPNIDHMVMYCSYQSLPLSLTRAAELSSIFITGRNKCSADNLEKRLAFFFFFRDIKYSNKFA